MVAKKLNKLWKKLNFPIITETSIAWKIEALVNKYDNYLKYHNECAQVKFEKMFDVTKTDGIWLANEDKQFYEMQMKSKGEVGNATSVQVKVHPSKVGTGSTSNSRTCNRPSLSKNVASNLSSSSETSDNDTNDCNYIVEPPAKIRKTKQYSTTKSAFQQVKQTNLSSSTSPRVYKQLSDKGIDIPTPT